MFASIDMTMNARDRSPECWLDFSNKGPKLKEFMVQLQTFNTSDYLLKMVALIIISYKIERKNGKKLFNTFEISKNIVSIFSGRILIGQNDSLDVLLLNDFFCDFKKVEMTWLMDINCNAISKLFAGFLNFVTTRPRGWIHKTVLLCLFI